MYVRNIDWYITWTGNSIIGFHYYITSSYRTGSGAKTQILIFHCFPTNIYIWQFLMVIFRIIIPLQLWLCFQICYLQGKEDVPKIKITGGEYKRNRVKKFLQKDSNDLTSVNGSEPHCIALQSLSKLKFQITWRLARIKKLVYDKKNEAAVMERYIWLKKYFL